MTFMLKSSHCSGFGIALISEPTNDKCCINRHLSVLFVSFSLFVSCSSLVLSSVPLVGSQPPATALPWVSAQFNVHALAQQLWLEPQCTRSCGVLAFLSFAGRPLCLFLFQDWLEWVISPPCQPELGQFVSKNQSEKFCDSLRWTLKVEMLAMSC